MTKVKNQIVQTFFLFAAFLILPTFALADWQSTLGSYFDHVETFDNLTDWKGTCNPSTGWVYSGPPGSIFNGYCCWGSAAPATNWIQNFGSGTNVSGKSLSMDMNDSKGPDRMLTYIGDGTPTSGYDDVYIFFRVKFSSGLFIPPTSSNYWGYFKFFTPSVGFTNVSTWGTAAERATACQDPQTLMAYGPNYFIMNWDYIGSLRNVSSANPRPAYSGTCSRASGTGIQTDNSIGDDGTHWLKDNDMSEGNGTFDMYNYTGRMLGLEIHNKLGPDQGGTPHNRYLTSEWWLYDETGQVLHHWMSVNNGVPTEYRNGSLTGRLIPGSALFPTHKYNRFEIGGNVQVSPNGGGPPSGQFYVDDFIIDGSRIGPTYYSLLNGTSDTTPPAAPTVLRAR